LVEAMERRQLLTASAADIIQNPFPATNASVEGRVYQDNNQDFIFDAGDVPLAGQTVFVDVNVNLVPDAGDEIAQTDANGEYFMLVLGGTGTTLKSYTVGCVAAPGLQLLTNFYSIAFLAGDVVTGIDFPQIGTAAIDVSVFGDANANGIQDTGETGLDNRTVYLDNNNNSVFDAGDLQAFNSGSGNYQFNGLPAGTYTVRVQTPDGTSVTTPVGGSSSIVLGSGQVASTTFGLNGPDLSIQLLSVPPASLFGGVKQKPIQVSVANAGTSFINGSIGVNIYASTDNVFSPGADTVVSSLLGKPMRLRPGQAKKLKVQLTVPTDFPSGTYFLIPQVVSSISDENAANDAAVPAAPTVITKPFTDLAISYGSQPIYLWDRGTTASVGVFITNNGNFTFDGQITLAVYASIDGTLASSTLLTQTRPKHLKLAPGTAKAMGVSIPHNGMQSGTFFIITAVNPSAVIGDSNPANNSVVSTQTTQII